MPHGNFSMLSDPPEVLTAGYDTGRRILWWVGAQPQSQPHSLGVAAGQGHRLGRLQRVFVIPEQSGGHGIAGPGGVPDDDGVIFPRRNRDQLEVEGAVCTFLGDHVAGKQDLEEQVGVGLGLAVVAGRGFLAVATPPQSQEDRDDDDPQQRGPLSLTEKNCPVTTHPGTGDPLGGGLCCGCCIIDPFLRWMGGWEVGSIRKKIIVMSATEENEAEKAFSGRIELGKKIRGRERDVVSKRKRKGGGVLMKSTILKGAWNFCTDSRMDVTKLQICLHCHCRPRFLLLHYSSTP